MREERLYTFIDADDSVPFTKLKLGEQLRILLRRITYDPATELAAEDIATREYLRRKADLMDFIRRALEPIRKGKHRSVLLSVSGEFSGVLNEVLSSPEIQNYFVTKVARPKLDYEITADILLSISVRDA